MTVTIDILGSAPKRGDILQTNVGNSRERTFLVTACRVLREKIGMLRYKVWAHRWWELDTRFRLALFRSADRHGGQNVILFKRYAVKKRKQTFEEYMRRPVYKGVD